MEYWRLWITKQNDSAECGIVFGFDSYLLIYYIYIYVYYIYIYLYSILTMMYHILLWIMQDHKDQTYSTKYYQPDVLFLIEPPVWCFFVHRPWCPPWRRRSHVVAPKALRAATSEPGNGMVDYPRLSWSPQMAKNMTWQFVYICAIFC